jgi:murein DD-endopeptidase MepM/ murein hydrolase activator NlpD
MASRHGRWIAGVALFALAGCIPHGAPPENYGATPYAPPRASGQQTRPLPIETTDARDGQVRSVDVPSAIKQPTPSWIARSVQADAETIPGSSYTVKPGDTLRSIGNRTGAGSEAIARANAIPAPFMVHTGQKLKIPAGRYHLVREGQSGVAIARAYGVSWSEVATLNDLQPPYILRNGQRLALPSAAEVAGMSVEQRAAAFQLDIDDLVTGGEPAIARNAEPAQPTETPKKPVPTDKAVAEPSRFAGRFDWPLNGRILNRFGPTGDGRRNDGINIAAEKGDPIRAAADGVIAYAGSAIAVYGGLILIKHGDGWITAYGHAEEILVTRGQAVKRGDIIGHAGATGSVNKPQLHFEIRNKRTPVDPLRYLPTQP